MRAVAMAVIITSLCFMSAVDSWGKGHPPETEVAVNAITKIATQKSERSKMSDVVQFVLIVCFMVMLQVLISGRTTPTVTVIFAAFVAGVVLTISYTFMPSVAPWYSQMIHDCGVRVAGEGVTVEKMIGIRVDGHKYAVCWPD